MNRLERVSLPIANVKERLGGIISEEYLWPKELAGWWLEFIAYPDGAVVMDLLHPVSGRWWSDDNELLPQPFLQDGRGLTAGILKKAGVPFMGTFGVATVSELPSSSYLKEVKE